MPAGSWAISPARSVWSGRLHEFPGDQAFGARLAAQGSALCAVSEGSLDADTRHGTSFAELALNTR